MRIKNFLFGILTVATLFQASSASADLVDDIALLVTDPVEYAKQEGLSTVVPGYRAYRNLKNSLQAKQVKGFYDFYEVTGQIEKAQLEKREMRLKRWFHVVDAETSNKFVPTELDQRIQLMNAVSKSLE